MQAAISNTISAIYSDSQFILTNQSSSRILCLALANDEIVEYLQKLTTRANDAASSLACGSILAGHSSESDEFGDVAFYIGSGDYGQGNEIKVLQALKLSQSWAHRNRRPLNLSSLTHLPLNIPTSSSATLTSLMDSLKPLNNIYGFTVQGGPGSGGIILYILLGCLPNQGWVGLVGVGIQVAADD